MEKVSTEEIIENKALREQCIARVEILDKVKSLMLIPQMECMTIKQVADYYDVPLETAKSQYKSNKDEFDLDGAIMKTPTDFKNLNGCFSTFKNLQQVNGKLIVQIDDNTTLEIPNRGIRVFPKRAILRMGMLLRDSKVAQEVRTQLLNAIEKAEETNPKILTEAIDEEKELATEIVNAYLSGDAGQTMLASQKLDQFRKRHISALEEHNKTLQTKNEALATDNKLLSGEILKWKDRNYTNAVMRKLASTLHINFNMAWGILYKQLKYKFGIDVKMRGDRNKPYIQYIRDDEWTQVQQSIAAILEENNISPTTFFSTVNKATKVKK